MEAGPPESLRRLLGWLLPGGVRGESILADLEEEYEGREEGVTRDLWYGWEALRLVVHYRVLAPGREVGAKSKMGRGSGMGGIVRDLAYAFRRLRRDPLLMGVAVLTMGLGIGSAVAIFAVVDAVLLEPLPYEEPEALVAIFEADLDRGVTRNVANAGNAREWEAGAPSIQEIAGAVMPMPTVLEVVGEPREVVASPVTPNYFQVLGMEPEIGRLSLLPRRLRLRHVGHEKLSDRFNHDRLSSIAVPIPMGLVHTGVHSHWDAGEFRTIFSLASLEVQCPHPPNPRTQG